LVGVAVAVINTKLHEAHWFYYTHPLCYPFNWMHSST
jgi:hypothetical protein